MSTSSALNPDSVLVLGATGKTGRRVTDLLGSAARPASRSASTKFDWADPDTWEPAVAGTTAVYVVPPENPLLLNDFVGVAVKAGVTRLVLLSMRGAPDDDPFEAAVKDSGAEWTVLRPTWFMQNFDEDMFAGPVQQGELAVPAGQGVHPFIDVVDIAEVAVVALTQPGHHGRTYDLSGPEALSFPDVLARISEVTGKPVRYVDIAAEEFTEALRGHGYSDEIADLVTMLVVLIREGKEAHVADGVQRVLGREPRTFADYLGSSKFA
ncbi:NmrA family NAD(P)-binding protein [Lentzea sp. NPDC055074]